MRDVKIFAKNNREFPALFYIFSIFPSAFSGGQRARRFTMRTRTAYSRFLSFLLSTTLLAASVGAYGILGAEKVNINELLEKLHKYISENI